MRDREYRFAELRADGDSRTLRGTLIRYGDVATFPWGEERIEQGAFGNLSDADLILNVMHERPRALCRTGGSGLEVRDSGSLVEVAAAIPQTRDGDDALVMVRNRVFRGFSVEMLVKTERVEGRQRIIEEATLTNIALVDEPAYPASQVAARWRQRAKPQRRVYWW